MIPALLAGILIMLVREVSADGGVTAGSRAEGPARTTAFVEPVAPRVGPVDVSVLLTPQPIAFEGSSDDPRHGAVRLLVVATHIESGIERSDMATPAHRGNRLLRSCVLQLPRDGRWRIEVLPGCDLLHRSLQLPSGWPSLTFEIEVAPSLPPWRTQWPWLLAWIPMTALLLWRDRLVAGRRPAARRRADGASITIAPRK